jgi:hypothetical protein
MHLTKSHRKCQGGGFSQTGRSSSARSRQRQQRGRTSVIASSSRGAIRIGTCGVNVGPHATWPGEMSSHSRAGRSSAAGRISIAGDSFPSPEGTVAEAPVVALPTRRGAYPTVPGVPPASPGSTLWARQRAWRRQALALSEARRASNRDRVGLVPELRCECTRPNCRHMLPTVADAHRGIADRFVVAPVHFEGGVVVRAADRFFVVESVRQRLRHTGSAGR